MGIESSFDARLWNAVNKPYDERNYTAVILDGIQYLGDVIREKTGLASDGMSLVGEAFGGSKPKLRVNRFETDTDKNVQGGIEHLVRGLFKAFRNPRSHEKHVDSKEDADTVLFLVSYLLKVIGQARSPFERALFLQRVFDAEFVQSSRYAELLASEIPAKHQFDILVDIYRDRAKGDGKKLATMLAAVWEKVSAESKSEFAAIVSADLYTIDRSELQAMIELLPPDAWPLITDAARIRTENILIGSIREGLYDDSREECTSGALGTWATSLMGAWLLKADLSSAVAAQLESKDRRAADYIFMFIFPSLASALDEPGYWLEKVLLTGLVCGDERFKDALDFVDCQAYDPITFDEIDGYAYPGWRKPFVKAMDEFKVQEPRERAHPATPA